jgi:SAM-dependent methyltransferase
MSEDVPSGVDFHDPVQALEWIDRTVRERPYRARIFARMAAELAAAAARPLHVVELGSGPGHLAEAVLDHGPGIASYTLVDFSEPMLEVSRERLAGRPQALRFLQLDFRDPDWTARVGVADAVLSTQAIHELRHKRKAAALYAQVRSVLAPGGVALLCDHTPGDEPDARRTALFMTVEEQLAALRGAGFLGARLLMQVERLALYRASAPAP